MTVEKRQEIERRIVRRLVQDALDAGYRLSVNNGGDEDEIAPTDNKQEILEALFATDSEHLQYHDASGRQVGAVYLVYGNDGYDVICDYSVNLESLLEGANEVADAAETYSN
jgi:hypothetical protein